MCCHICKKNHYLSWFGKNFILYTVSDVTLLEMSIYWGCHPTGDVSVHGWEVYMKLVFNKNIILRGVSLIEQILRALLDLFTWEWKETTFEVDVFDIWFDGKRIGMVILPHFHLMMARLAQRWNCLKGFLWPTHLFA